MQLWTACPTARWSRFLIFGLDDYIFDRMSADSTLETCQVCQTGKITRGAVFLVFREWTRRIVAPSTALPELVRRFPLPFRDGFRCS
jgi:hypothetical protein